GKEEGGGGENGGSSRSARPGLAGPTAATTWRQNRTGSLSPASSDSQATGRPLRRAQSASATVLPYPAGAQTSTSPCASPSSSRTARRGRGTKPGRGRGRCRLVARRTSCPETATSAADPARGSAIGAPLLSASCDGEHRHWV